MATVPIKFTDGVELRMTHVEGIAAVSVTDHSASKKLSWDRFVRLKTAAEALPSGCCSKALDAGGYDGALAFFLHDVTVDVIDPATTGGSISKIPVEDAFYDAVFAVDVLEHIEPNERAGVLSELARVSRKYVILNYPCRSSAEAQKLALKLTNNALIREHVEWELPDSDWVLSELNRHGFSGFTKQHTNIGIWLGQYILLNLEPKQSIALNRYLIENFADEPFSKPLYHLVVCEKAGNKCENF